MAKKILIITNDLLPFVNANSSIAYTIATELKSKYGLDVFIMGYDRFGCNVPTECEESPKELRAETLCTYFFILRSCGKNRWKRFYRLFQHPKALRFYVNNKLRPFRALAIEYRSELKRVLNADSFDCIIAVSEPPASLKALNMLKGLPPVISYKLDPWASNYYTRNKAKEAQEEWKSDLNAAGIIVTKPIYQEYLSAGTAEILPKLHVVDFPKLIRDTAVVPKKQDLFGREHTINCVFIGNLYPDIRSPQYTIDLFSVLRENGIKFHLIGGNGECFDENDLPPNVIYHGYVPSAKAEEYMQAADILVNIGNSVKNQVPSKLISYISTGKPIVNFIKSPDCPTLDYMNRYPLALNIQESDTAQNWQAAEALLNFCKEHAGQSIGWDRIKDLYHECTPEYVTSKVYDVIKEVVNR